ncbi:MAG: CHAD domain-containing protein [Planctomycetes bacterium]|nr:CHAD domain-containing protein [Planctomycetota bacterium]
MPLEERLETEFKLRARQPLEVAAVDARLRQAGLSCSAATFVDQLDTYLDDAGASLREAGVGLRLRRTQQGATLTCKRRGTRQGARYEREELECDWPGGDLPTSTTQLPIAIRDVVEPLLRDSGLVEQLHLHVHRERRVLQHEGIDVCEVAIDRVVARCGARQASFDEIELEVLDDTALSERLCETLMRELPVEAAEQDKPTHAAALLGMAPRRRTPAAPADEPADAIGPAVLAAIERHLAEIRRTESEVRRLDDAEPLHAMRVALRRLRTLVGAFAELWPADLAASIKARLAATSHRLGDVRDLDVLLIGIDAAAPDLPQGLHEATQAVSGWLRRERDQARARLVDWLRDAERLRDFGQLQTDLASLPLDTPQATQDQDRTLATKISEAGRRARKRLRGLPSDAPLSAMHRARLACKRLRYLVEEPFDSEGEGGGSDPVARDFLDALVRLQRSLGQACDHGACSERLLLAASRLPGHAPQASIAALGGLATWHAQAMRKRRDRATRLCGRLARKKNWRWLTPAP